MEFKNNFTGTKKSDGMTLTSSLYNTYIPIREAHSTIGRDSEDIYYAKPCIAVTSVVSKRNTIRNILQGLYNMLYPYEISINNNRYYFSKGLITNERNEVLLVMAMRKEAFFDQSVPRLEPMVKSYKYHALFFASTFFTDPHLLALGRRLQKEILEPCYKKGIEVKILAPELIEKNTFARPFEIQISSISNLENYLQTKLTNYLYETDEDAVEEEIVVSPTITEDPEELIRSYPHPVESLVARLRPSAYEQNLASLRFEQEMELQHHLGWVREQPLTPENAFPIGTLTPIERPLPGVSGTTFEVPLDADFGGDSDEVVTSEPRSTPGSDYIAPANTDNYPWVDALEYLEDQTRLGFSTGTTDTTANLGANLDSYEWVEPDDEASPYLIGMDFASSDSNSAAVWWRSSRRVGRMQTLELVDDSIELIDDTED